MIFDDTFEIREVLSVGFDDEGTHKYPGITTPNGWYSIPYFISQYSTLPTNAELLEYCQINYPEYCI